ncbi:AAEL000638-PA, partial [Aedes aegypti]
PTQFYTQNKLKILKTIVKLINLRIHCKQKICESNLFGILAIPIGTLKQSTVGGNQMVQIISSESVC